MVMICATLLLYKFVSYHLHHQYKHHFHMKSLLTLFILYTFHNLLPNRYKMSNVYFILLLHTTIHTGLCLQLCATIHVYQHLLYKKYCEICYIELSYKQDNNNVKLMNSQVKGGKRNHLTFLMPKFRSLLPKY